MPYSEYKFDPEWISDQVSVYKSNLKANKGTDDLVGNALRVISKRLENDPRRYRDYGPYWPALKNVLLAHEAAKGYPVSPEIAAEYRGNTEEETLVLAEEFRKFYLSHYFLYTNNWMLDADAEEEWLCLDPDYEPDNP